MVASKDRFIRTFKSGYVSSSETYLRQNDGKNRTKMVKSSRRPKIIPAESTHFAPSGNEAKFPVGPMICPIAGPTLQIAVAAPVIAVI